MFDLITYPLNLTAGRELNDLPGLLVTGAPRKAARMRAQDQLILCLNLRAAGGNGFGAESPSYTPAQQQEMLDRLAETYFAFSGSVTAGLRTVAARLNDFLLSRNLKSGSEVQTVGILNMAVIHGASLYAAHAGMTHTFILSRSQVQHFDDRAGSAGRGLGLARQAVPRFYQAQFEPGDLIIFCTDPPATWTTRALAGSPQLNFEQLRRRLLSDAPVELRAAVIRTQAGKGKISTWKPGTAGSPAVEAPREETRPPAAPTRGRLERAPRQQESAPQEVAAPKELAAADKPPESQAAPAADKLPPAENLPTVEKTPLPASGEAETVDFSAVPGAAVYEEPAAPAAQPPAEENVQHAEQPASKITSGAPASRRPRLGVFLGRLMRRSGSRAAARRTQPSPRPQAARTGAAQSTAPAQAAMDADFSPPQAALKPRVTPRVSGSLASVPHANGTYTEEALEPAAAQAVSQEPPQASAPPTLAKAFSGAARGIRGAWQKGASSRARVGGSMATTARKVMPRRVDEAGKLVPLFNFSTGTMIGIAILIPIVVVAVATAVYFEAGRGEQYQVLFEQAQQYAQASAQLTDPIQQREGWNRTLELLDEAEAYKRSEESAALRKQARDGLDAIQGITRLNYTRVVRTFTEDVKITRMVASLNDVYLLDGAQGRIIRLYRTATGYEVDPQFTCGSTEPGALEVKPLVDLALPQINNEPRATIVGLDEVGDLVYCAPNMDGFESRTLAPPDTGWGRITAMKIYSGRLYVLDPPKNAVYYYDSDNGIYPDKPHFYFGDSIPRMDDVIDIAVDQEFLYLLHDDGQMTICEGGGYSLAPTTCTDAPYGDSRPGMEPSPLRFDKATFTQLQATQPPDPSLFVLDTANQSIYHLSLRRLNLQREYRPRLDTDFPVPNTPPTAFAVAPNRRALVAFGNQVFFAPIP